MAVTDERSLPQAVDQLYDAVAGLVDPIKKLTGGSVKQAPSLYDTLVSEIAASSGGDTYSRGVGRSLPPVWLDATDLRIQIDGRVKSWLPEQGSTPARLRALASKRWRPQDVGLISDYAAETQSWAVAIRALIEPQHVKSLAAACPQCGERYVYRPHAGESVRQPALQLIADQGCTCQSCKAFWAPTRYLFLLRLLGWELPAGVLE